MRDWRSFDGVAEAYERLHAHHMAMPARDLVALADPGAGARVLDVGAGTGVATEAAQGLLDGQGLAIGIDLSVGMLRQARLARPALRLAAADAIDLPFRDGTFDIVTANFVLHFFPNVKTALFDMIRVLRPGGRLATSTWTEWKDELSDTWRELALEVLQEELLDDAMVGVAPGRDRFADRAVLEQTLYDAGLRHVRTEKHEYRFDAPIDAYVEGLGTTPSGRFVREMLGPDGWGSFLERAKDVFRQRFADPVHDFSRAWLAVATKG